MPEVSVRWFLALLLVRCSGCSSGNDLEGTVTNVFSRTRLSTYACAVYHFSGHLAFLADLVGSLLFFSALEPFRGWSEASCEPTCPLTASIDLIVCFQFVHAFLKGSELRDPGVRQDVFNEGHVQAFGLLSKQSLGRHRHPVPSLGHEDTSRMAPDARHACGSSPRRQEAIP